MLDMGFAEQVEEILGSSYKKGKLNLSASVSTIWFVWKKVFSEFCAVIRSARIAVKRVHISEVLLITPTGLTVHQRAAPR